VTGTTPSYRPNFDLFIRRESPPPLAREAIAAYYAAISFMDSQLGRVLAELDRLHHHHRALRRPRLAFGREGHVVEAGLAGRSLRPLLDQPKSAWDKPAYAFIKRGKIMGASVCDERYRYTEWDQGRAGAELYDHQADPAEVHNLAADPEQSTRVKAVRQLLAQV
jgi:arylsulfatase A-like enzyme